MKGLILRQFKDKDKKDVFGLHVSALKDAGTWIGNVGPTGKKWDEDLEDIEMIYINNHGEFLVATIDSEVIGMGALRRVDAVTAEIKRMRVRPLLQGRGIGKVILDKLIVLDVAAKQKAARHLYESRNFQEYKKGMLGGQPTVFYKRAI
jgi:GNAT superfamily N-acetyltransferase